VFFYLSIYGLWKGPGKFHTGVLESPGKVWIFFQWKSETPVINNCIMKFTVYQLLMDYYQMCWVLVYRWVLHLPRCLLCRSTAITCLDRVCWNGKHLKVSMSKHASVQLPRDSLPVSCARDAAGRFQKMKWKIVKQCKTKTTSFSQFSW